MNFLQNKLSFIQWQTLILIFIGFLFLWLGLPSLYKRISWCDGYALGDWIVNYEDGGFKRRGLSGSFFIFLSRISGVYIGKLVFLFISVQYVLFVTLFIAYFRRIKFDFWLMLFTLLPTVILFPVNDLYAFGRKEILFFNLFLFFLISYKKTDVYKWKYIGLLSTLIFVITLFHELDIFYIPYILLIYFKDLHLEKKGSLPKILVVGLSTFVPALLIFIVGADINEGHSWEIFKELGVSSNVMNGIFSWPKEGFGKGQVNALIFAFRNNYLLYFVSYFITFSVFLVLIIKNKFLRFNIKNTLFFHFLLLFISIPIFILTIDWGRWLNIHFISMLFIISLFYLDIDESLQYSVQQILNKMISKNILIKSLILFFFVFDITMQHVDVGFKFGQNNFLEQLRDLFWNLRHFNF
jgi:hypothetical protein